MWIKQIVDGMLYQLNTNNIYEILTGIQTKINNIVTAIADGMFQPSMKETLDTLEKNKSKLEIRIIEAEDQLEVHTPTKEMITKDLEKDKNIRNMDKNEQKRVINTYVSSIVVFTDTMEINTIMDFNGGDGGS